MDERQHKRQRIKIALHSPAMVIKGTSYRKEKDGERAKRMEKEWGMGKTSKTER